MSGDGTLPVKIIRLTSDSPLTYYALDWVVITVDTGEIVAAFNKHEEALEFVKTCNVGISTESV